MTVRRHLVRSFALACASLCLVLPCARAAAAVAAGDTDTAAAPDADAIRATVERTIRPLMEKYRVPGMAIAVSVDGKAMLFNYGVASRTSQQPVGADTLFELGSVSKTFTATLACHARDLGKLSFSDRPSQYLPALKDSPLDRATLLDFGTYTAGGLPLQVPDEIEDDAQMLAWLRAFQPQAEPGAVRRYSNISLGLFGRVTARALHADFGDAVQGRLLPALGLAHTYMHVPPGAMADYAWGEDQDGQPARVHPGVFDLETYGIASSAADMIRYVQANIDASPLAAPMQRALACTHVGFYRAGEIVQGLGWEQLRGPLTLQRLLDANSDRMINTSTPATRLVPPTPAPSGTLFDKTGSTRGFGAYVAFVPSQRIGIVLLANKNVPIPARVEAAYAILARLVPDGQALGRR